MAAFKSVLLRLVYSCSRYSEEYGDGSFWMAQKPPFATGNFGSEATVSGLVSTEVAKTRLSVPLNAHHKAAVQNSTARLWLPIRTYGTLTVDKGKLRVPSFT